MIARVLRNALLAIAAAAVLFAIFRRRAPHFTEPPGVEDDVPL